MCVDNKIKNFVIADRIGDILFDNSSLANAEDRTKHYVLYKIEPSTMYCTR